MDFRNQEEDAARETSADAGCCKKCEITACVALVISTAALVMGFLLGSIIVWWTAAPGRDYLTSETSVKLTDGHQLCQKERYDWTLMLQTVTQDSRCRLCPDTWMWWWGHCYFFSVGLKENLRWNESAEFCREHGSSLVVIKDSAEMEFIKGVMKSFTKSHFPWVGLTDVQQEGRWLWLDGTDIQGITSLTVEWDSDQRDCADLRGGGRLFADTCETYGPWICKKVV